MGLSQGCMQETNLKAPLKSLFSKRKHKKKWLSNKSESLNRHLTVTLYSHHKHIFIAAVDSTISTTYMYIPNVNHDKTWQMFVKNFELLKQVKKYPELSLCWT